MNGRSAKGSLGWALVALGLVTQALVGCFGPPTTTTPGPAPGADDPPFNVGQADLVTMAVPRFSAPLATRAEVSNAELGVIDLGGQAGASLLEIRLPGERLDSARLIVVGAWVDEEGRIASNPRQDQWLFARVLLPGASVLTYGTHNQLVGGNVLVSINESVFGGFLAWSVKSYVEDANATGLDAARVLLLVAFDRGSLPPGRLALVVAWDEEQRFDFRVPLGDLVNDLSSRAVGVQLPTVGTSSEAHLSYYSDGDGWNFVRLPTAQRETDVSVVWTVSDPGVSHSIDGRKTLSMSLPDSNRYAELFMYYRGHESAGQWCLEAPFASAPIDECRYFADGPASRIGGPFAFAIRKDSRSTDGIVRLAVDVASENTTTWATVYIASFGLDLEEIVGLPMADYTYVSEQVQQPETSAWPRHG